MAVSQVTHWPTHFFNVFNFLVYFILNCFGGHLFLIRLSPGSSIFRRIDVCKSESKKKEKKSERNNMEVNLIGEIRKATGPCVPMSGSYQKLVTK